MKKILLPALLALLSVKGYGQNVSSGSCLSSITPPLCASSDPAVCAKLNADYLKLLSDWCVRGDKNATSKSVPHKTVSIGCCAGPGEPIPALIPCGPGFPPNCPQPALIADPTPAELERGLAIWGGGDIIEPGPLPGGEYDVNLIGEGGKQGYGTVKKKPEPIDVAAIRETFCCFGFTGPDCDETRPLKPFYEPEYFPGYGHIIFGRPAVMPQHLFWCADKSRILLTDESGGKHCIKFPKN